MTEDDARTKFCPMQRIRLKGSDKGSCNILVEDDGSQTTTKCIASDCMMWVKRYPDSLTCDEGHCGLAK